MLVTSLFGGVRELTDKNFDKAIARDIVVVEFWATWNEVNKVTLLDEWENFDVKVYRVNIDLYPKIQADNDVVILPTIIFFDDGDEICGDVDGCPYDAENDADSDGICGDEDECPYDGDNDIDGDGICGDEDECPYDEILAGRDVAARHHTVEVNTAFRDLIEK